MKARLFWQLTVTLVYTGKSVRPPLHVGVYFEPQENIDEFVSTYTVGKATAAKILPLRNMHKIIQLYMT